MRGQKQAAVCSSDLFDDFLLWLLSTHSTSEVSNPPPHHPMEKHWGIKKKKRGIFWFPVYRTLKKIIWVSQTVGAPSHSKTKLKLTHPYGNSQNCYTNLAKNKNRKLKKKPKGTAVSLHEEIQLQLSKAGADLVFLCFPLHLFIYFNKWRVWGNPAPTPPNLQALFSP